MRMRRKKNLEERLEKVKDYLFIAEGEDLNFNTAILEKNYLNLAEIFQNDHPLHLEIGCGKGQFACEIAQQHPELNFLAVEKCANVIVEACEKAQGLQISNLRFLKSGAEYLERYLPNQSVARIYLNFSCPFPKKSYAVHRLTNQRFLKIYENLLKPQGEIHQKTDNLHFFEYSLEQLSDYGYTLKNISLDLHHSDFEGNIVTEYEQKFSDLGFPIYRLEAYLKK